MQDFYWKRNGLRWEVWHQDGDKHTLLFRFWLERRAAQVCNALFSAYHHGRNIECERRQS